MELMHCRLSLSLPRTDDLYDGSGTPLNSMHFFSVTTYNTFILHHHHIVYILLDVSNREKEKKGILMHTALSRLFIPPHNLRQFHLQVRLTLFIRQLGRLPLLLLSRSRLSLLLLGRGVRADGFVHRGVQVFQILRFDPVLQVLCEMNLVLLRVFFHHFFHVFTHVSTKDVLAERFCVEFLGITVVADEAFFVVRDVEAAVEGALQHSEYLGAGGGALQPGIEDAEEGAGPIIHRVNVVIFTHIFRVSLVHLVQTEFLEGAAGQEEAGGVGSGVVGKASLETVARELVGVGSRDDDITGEGGIGDLAHDVAVGETDNEAVLGGVVLVLVLGAETETSTVVGLALSAATVLDLWSNCGVVWCGVM